MDQNPQPQQMMVKDDFPMIFPSYSPGAIAIIKLAWLSLTIYSCYPNKISLIEFDPTFDDICPLMTWLLMLYQFYTNHD